MPLSPSYGCAARTAPQALAHLNAGHADALAACLRAGGHDAAFARATRWTREA